MRRVSSYPSNAENCVLYRNSTIKAVSYPKATQPKGHICRAVVDIVLRQIAASRGLIRFSTSRTCAARLPVPTLMLSSEFIAFKCFGRTTDALLVRPDRLHYRCRQVSAA